MDTSSRSTFWIAIGLTATFLMGGLAATSGIAFTRVAAAVLFDGHEYVRAGQCQANDGWAARDECPMTSDRSAECRSSMRAHGMQFEWEDDRAHGPRDQRPGMNPGECFPEAGLKSQDFGESCPMWGTF